MLARVLLAVALATAVCAAPAQAASHKKAHVHKHVTKKKKKKVAKKARVSTPKPVVTAAPAVVAPAAPAQCANTDLVPDASNLDLVRAAIMCLHNQIRAQNGLTTLAENAALDNAGGSHSGEMVAEHYFDHTAPSGLTFSDRIFQAGYADPDDAWQIGENLAWGTGSLATPAAIMNAWMNSPEHRANVLQPSYRELGVGLQLGTPQDPTQGVTVSAEFGVRG